MTTCDQAQPEVDQLWYRRMIEYIKQAVGEGAEYFNDLLRVVLSERGCYYQFHRVPEEFSGALGSGFSYRFLGTAQARALLAQVETLLTSFVTPDSEPPGSELSVLAIYQPQEPGGEESAFVFDCRPAENRPLTPTISGAHPVGVLPAFLKLKVRSAHAIPILGASAGILFFAANLTDRHLVVRIPQVGPGYDLSQLPAPATLH